MEEIVLIVGDKQIETFTNMTLSGAYTSVARQLDFSILAPTNDKEIPIVDLPIGAAVSLRVGGAEIFYGHIYDKSTSTNSHTDSYTCYDPLFVMLHEDAQVTFNFKNTTPDDATRQICEAVGLDYGGCDVKGEGWDRILEDINAYEAMMTMWTLQAKKDGKKYMPIIKDRKVYIIQKGYRKYKYVMDPDSSIINANYKESYKGLFGSSKLYDKNNNEVGKVGEVLERSASIEILGDLNLMSGSSVVLAEPHTGLYGLFYIDQDSHNFSGGIITTNLDLEFKNLMDYKEANSEKEEVEELSDDNYSGGMTGTSVPEQMWSYLLSKGYTKEAIAGIMGNAGQESNYKPTAVNPSSGSYGLFQWLGSRKQALSRFASNRGTSISDVKTQLDFMIQELEAMSGGKQFATTGGSVENKTIWFRKNFERPAEWEANDPRRIEYAKRAYSQYSNWKPKSNNSTYMSSSGEKPASAIAGKAIKSGESIIGTRYLWAGNTPATGIDCSGFVQWCYNQNGGNIPGRLTTSELARAPAYYGFRRISWNEMRPGDVVYVAGHVGMYYGNGKTIESGGTSSSVLGYSGVAITNNLGYFKSAYRYVGW